MYNDSDIRNDFQQCYQYARDYWAPYIKDAQVYTLAASGYTWSDRERKELIKEGREPLEFNIIRRPLQFFSGYLRDNINEIVYAPVEGSDQKTADQFTKLSYYIWDKGQGFPTFLDACDEGIKSGIALCGIQMDYSRDFINGDISFFKRTYNSFYLDPTFENIDLSDCAFAITRDLVDKEFAKQLLQDVDPKEIDGLAKGFRDDKFVQYRPAFTTFARNVNLIAYDQFYKRTTKKRKFLVDLSSNYYRDITDLPSEDLKKLKFGINRLEQMRYNSQDLEIDDREIPNVEIKTVNRPYVDLHVLLNGHNVYSGPDKTGVDQSYPFVPILCYMEPSIFMPSQRLQGIPACNWSAQRQFNKRHMKIVDMMDSDIATGYKYMIGSVADVSDLQQSGQNKIIGIDPENAPQGIDSVQQLQGGGTNPALIQYQEVLDNLTLTLSNVNESTLGVDEKGNTQISGRLAQVRIAQGLRGNRKIFDGIETSMQLLGGKILTAIQTHYPPGKVERILAETPTQQFYDKEFEQYDAVIKEGVRSKSQKDAYYYELVALKREGIVDVPEAEIIRSLAMSGLSDLEEAMQQRDEMKKEEAAKLQEAAQVEIDVMKATKEEKLGLAQERRSRVISNLALKDERESESVENMANAALERAKAITEIADLNEDRILKVLQYIDVLEQQEMQAREMQKSQVTAEANTINQETQGTKEDILKQQQEQMMMQQQQQQEDPMTSMLNQQ